MLHSLIERNNKTTKRKKRKKKRAPLVILINSFPSSEGDDAVGGKNISQERKNAKVMMGGPLYVYMADLCS